MTFSVNIVLQLHSTLFRHMPNHGGHWKAAENDIVERNPDGTIKRIRFKPVKGAPTGHVQPRAIPSLVVPPGAVTGGKNNDAEPVGVRQS
ncbi:MAG: hypothetical protein JSU86_06980 [Phycisphaerales bacterium]|nr:MAG: hypothetical protein JSU86_06980 [Phycisphaerales bacterium]